MEILKKRFKIGEIIKSMFPNLPTDNLYKFVFVGCLFLIGLIVYGRIKKEDLLTESYDKYFIENIKQDLQYKSLQEEYKSINNEIDYWKAEGGNNYLRKRDSLRSLIRPYSAKLKVFEENDKILSKNLQIICEKKKEFEKEKFWSNCYIAIIGAIATASGFFWYFKLQILQDKILKQELRIKKETKI